MGEDPTTEFAADLALGVADRGVAAARRRLLPSPVDLVFDRTLTGCVHRGPVYLADHPVRAEWLRVGIRNSGTTSVVGVSVQALALEPDWLGVLPARLHWKDDNPPPGRPFQQSITVPASKSPIVFADVVSYMQGDSAFELHHIVPGVPRRFPVGGAYEVELIVTGEGVKARTRRFRFALDAGGNLEFARV